MSIGRQRLETVSPPDAQSHEAFYYREGPQTDEDLSPLAAMELLRRRVRTPILPEVLLQLFNLLGSDDSSAGDAVKVVSMDPSLAAAVLRTVNSASFGLSIRIDCLHRAVTLLGLNELGAMALGSTFLANFKINPECQFDLERYWQHSLATATCSRSLANNLRLDRPERYFLAGLLHDIGRLALYANLKGLAPSVEKYCREHLLPAHQVEKLFFGFDHAAFGATLLHSWNLPDGLVDMVRLHHEPSIKSEELPELIHVADVLATVLGYGPGSAVLVPRLDPAAWDCLGLSAADVPGLVERILPELDRTFRILSGVSSFWDNAA
ncbi:MAG: HDOD domain-containing protein [Okeania sp. SIO3B3]|nr:HDOD domain-containing protein [Okeania sp. SIO3B3]